MDMNGIDMQNMSLFSACVHIVHMYVLSISDVQ